MSDADLFMECEEEELEPWQQMDDDVEDEEVGVSECKSSTAPVTVVTAGPSSVTVVSPLATPVVMPPVGTPVALPIVSTSMMVSSANTSSDGKKPMVSLFTNTASPVSSVLPPSMVPPVPHSMPSLVPPGLPKPGPGQQLILTQSPGGLGTVAMSQVLQPMQVMPSAAAGPSAPSNQPIFFTTQDIPPTQRPIGHTCLDPLNMGFPVRNVRPVQNSINPLGIVLNVQQGQTVRPITLVPAPGNPFFKPAVGVPQVVPQPAPIRPATPVAVRPPTSSYTTVQIPATLTIRSTAPLSQALTTVAATMGTQPVQSPGLSPSTPTKIVNVCNLVTVKHGENNPDVQKLVNLVNAVSPTTVAQPQTVQVVVTNSRAPTNGLTAAPISVAAPSPLDSIKVGPATTVPAANVCPRCGAQFRMVEALRGHMCFCCPELMLSMKPSDGQKSMTTSTPPVTNPTLAPPIPAKPLPPVSPSAPLPQTVERGPSLGTDSKGNLVMLVDDFYYGIYEGNRDGATMDLLQQPVVFKCLSCSKRLKNNIRLMNHMKHHVELEQQNGEVDTHTNCQHCFRQFPTPFQLQCHLESVHSHYESTTKCKICEWAFESEPVFLQHMKNTHKPGEMPYVCQVCEYRSSFYADVYNHFRSWHEDTRYLLCLYCLRVFKNCNSYQQHYVRHQRKRVYHCNKCRLQFLFTKDKIEHKLNHHKTFRKPRQLEGLTPGTKVTIRAYAANKVMGQPPPIPPALSPVVSPVIPPANPPPGTLQAPPSRDTLSPKVGDVQPRPSHAHSEGKPQTTIKRRSVSKMLELLTKFQEQRATLGKQTCLECNLDVPDFPNHYPTYVHCSLCHYGTCCSRAYANHMINNHVPRKSRKYPAMYKRPAPRMKLACTSCNFTSQLGDVMAKHLVQNPSHCHSLCTLKGSPKIGFTVERQALPPNKLTNNQPYFPLPVHTPSLASSSKWEPGGPNEVLDQEMAPVEDIDTDTEQEEEQGACTVEEQKVRTENEDKAPCREEPEVSAADVKPEADAVGLGKEREETLSVRQLRIVLFALCCGIPQAAEHFNTRTQLIHTWLQEKERQLSRERRGGGGGEAVDRLVEWVLAQREQQLPVNEKNLFQKASEIHSHANQSSLFRISYEWAVGFMLQHDLGLQATGTVSRRLPRHAEESAQTFTEFVHKQIKSQNFSHSVIGAMDELSIFMDLDLLADSATVGKEPAFQLVGIGESLFDIFLAMLADGTLLPTMVFFKGQLPGRLRNGLPDSILLEAKVEGFTEEEEMELWTTQVWKKHMNSQNGSKGMLIMDTFRSHMLDKSLATISATSTLPTIVPAGCTCRLQPLEMCVRPVLQRFLQARWTKLAAQGGAAGANPKDLVQLLVAWLAEALASLSRQSGLLQRSFNLANVLSGPESHKYQANSQRDLVNALSEVMLGPEIVEPGPPAAESQRTEKDQVEKQIRSHEKSRDGNKMGKEEGEAKEDKTVERIERKEAKQQPKLQEADQTSNTSKQDTTLCSETQLPTSNPQPLRQIFDKDSDAESFLGFDDTELDP
ncbi:pogo transposable element derived with ZNF domain b isoform X3 [Megalops cyprinoides]|uniref:pogo transposable element derived with ZNF domain b isoform X3 n=1 Tax=Megalops cyprinoides TaxID=118141 RepID=UPI0018640EA5|nr:pogo transposable element derived with ZNF domain b isoform X3 [Megalops cyprinoides]